MRRNLIVNGNSEELTDKRINMMRAFFNDAQVEGYEELTSTMTNDPKDRHVLAAAIRGGAEVLVTFNLKDFPDASVNSFDVEVLHPDEFLLDQLDLHRAATLRGLVDLVDGYDSPAMTVEDFLVALDRAGVPGFADAAGDQFY